MSLGWLTESTLMPRKGKEIEDVGKATMVDMRAALYQTESALKQPEGHASAALADQRRRRERRRDPLAGSSNSGVGQRDAAASRQQREDEARVTEAMARKVAMYDAMARGEVPDETNSHGRSASSLAASASSLVDFELKQLRGDGDLLRLGAPSSTAADGDAGGRNGGDRGAPSLMSANMRREEERRSWEEAARREMDSTGPAVEAKRLHEEMSRETGLARASASDQRAKRQRALDERRATLRLKQEARSRASEEAAEGGAGPYAQETEIEEAWAAYNQQQGGMYAGQGRYGQGGYHHYEYPGQ